MTRLLFMVAALLVAPFSFAQFNGNVGGIPTQVVGPYSVPSSSGWYPGMQPSGATNTVSSSASSVTTTQTAPATATLPTGTRLSVPTTLAASVPVAAAAAAARGASKAIPVLGAGLLAYDIYNRLKEAGVPTCAEGSGAAFCNSPYSGPLTTAQVYWQQNTGGPFPKRPTIVDGCKDAAAYWSTIRPTFYFSHDNNTQCYLQDTVNGQPHYFWYSITKATGCADGYVASGTSCNYSGNTSGSTAMTDAELDKAISDKIAADPTLGKKLYDAIRNDITNRNLDVPKDTLYPPSTPVTVSNTPTTGPKEVVSTGTIQNSDGSTSTVKKEAQTTITPKQSGSTVADTSVTYTTQTVYTTTTTNNTTNVTNTTNETIQDTAREICKDTPDIAGCAKLGTPPTAETIPTQSINVGFTSIPFLATPTCPTPVSFNLGPYGGNKTISWQPFCDTMGQLRPIFVALATAAAALIFMMGFKDL